MAARKASGSSWRCSESRGTGRVLAGVGASVLAWRLWGGQGRAGFTPCQYPRSRTCFRASQLGPGRGSAFSGTWHAVIAIIRWGLGTRPLVLCGDDTRAGGGGGGRGAP